MDFHPIAAVKAHPWIAGAVVGVVALYWLYGGGGGATAPAGSVSDPNADALQVAQLQSQTQIAGAGIAAQAQAAHDAAAVTLGQRSFDSADFANQLAAEVALSQIGGQVAVQEGAQQVQIHSLDAATTQAQIASNTSIQNTSLLTSALVSQAQISAGVSESAINANAATQQQYIASNQAIQTQSWWDSLF